MTERRLLHDNKVQEKWVRCPTCRQYTDVGNIAYVDDRQSESCNSSLLQTIQDHEKLESSVVVQGSYGTKVFFLLVSSYKLQNLEITCMPTFSNSIISYKAPVQYYMLLQYMCERESTVG